MKSKYLLCMLVAATLASCSSQYKATQTPDDVYYSPAPAASVADNNKKEEDKKDRYNKEDKYESYTSADDQYLRMKTKNYNRWSAIDDYSYWYDTRYNDYYSYNNYNNYNSSSLYYGSGYSHCACSCYGSNSIFYPGYYNPGYYNPYATNYYTGYYYTNVYISNPKVTRPNVNRPQLGSYSNGSYSNTNSTGGTIKKIFSSGNGYKNSESRSTDTYKSTDRTYTPSSSSGSSSSGSSSSGSRVSRPGRN